MAASVDTMTGSSPTTNMQTPFCDIDTLSAISRLEIPKGMGEYLCEPLLALYAITRHL